MQPAANSKVSEKIFVEDFLADHIPQFISAKKEEVKKLNLALEQGDFAYIKKIGHNWKGVCASYGFRHLSDIGGQIEILSEQKKTQEIKNLLSPVIGYLDNAQIVVISEQEMDERLKNKEDLS